MGLTLIEARFIELQKQQVKEAFGNLEYDKCLYFVDELLKKLNSFKEDYEEEIDTFTRLKKICLYNIKKEEELHGLDESNFSYYIEEYLHLDDKKISGIEIEIIKKLGFESFNGSNFSIKKQNDGNTILMQLALKIHLLELTGENTGKYIKIFEKLLLIPEIDLNDSNNEGSTILSNSIMLEKINFIKLILNSGKRIMIENQSQFGNTYLDLAEAIGNKEIIKIIDDYFT